MILCYDIIKLNCIKDSDGYFYLDFYSFYPNIELTSNDNKICVIILKRYDYDDTT